MHHKYGQTMQPWEAWINMPNLVSGKDGEFDNFNNLGADLQYTYQMKNSQRSEIILERLPMRSINITSPNLYKVEHFNTARSEHDLKNRSYFINGQLSVKDGSFLSGFFISDIDKTNITIGPYPLYPTDID